MARFIWSNGQKSDYDGPIELKQRGSRYELKQVQAGMTATFEFTKEELQSLAQTIREELE